MGKDLNLKVGDRVECLVYGWGTVIKGEKHSNYIEFDNGHAEIYKKDGRTIEDANPTLSKTGWKKPKKKKVKETEKKTVKKSSEKKLKKFKKLVLESLVESVEDINRFLNSPEKEHEPVDFSILNEDDWFYVEDGVYKWLHKGQMFDVKKRNISICIGSFNRHDSLKLCEKEDVKTLRKATPEEIKTIYDKFPELDPDHFEFKEGEMYFSESKDKSSIEIVEFVHHDCDDKDCFTGICRYSNVYKIGEQSSGWYKPEFKPLKPKK